VEVNQVVESVGREGSAVNAVSAVKAVNSGDASALTVGISLPWDVLMSADPVRRRALLASVADSGIDVVTVGDHISFHGGVGFEGMVTASTVLATHDRLPVLIGVYLLGLRHPMLAARQISTLTGMAPGRLILGVGVGGDDRREIANTGIDPSTRGRRVDESLGLLRRLLDGEEVTHEGEFFSLDRAKILPTPEPQVPMVIGGKGEVAVRRTAALGDGWLGIFATARRFTETREQILEEADRIGRATPPTWFGVSAWCGLDGDRVKAEATLSADLEDLYGMSYDKIRHLAPAGDARHVAEWLMPFIEGGAGHVTLVPAGPCAEAGVEMVAEVASILRSTASRT